MQAVEADESHATAFPWVAGAEFAGIVVATPSGSSSPPRYPVGTRVFGASGGAYATLVCAPEHSILPVPDGWSLQHAAGLFITAPTAYAALVTRARVDRGDHVLVHAAAGGVGLAAVQGSQKAKRLSLSSLPRGMASLHQPSSPLTMKHSTEHLLR